MSGKWNYNDVPKRGWTCLNIADFEEPCHICEMCEARDVRYVHTMWHPDYYHELDVGCICAGHMEGNPAAARLREQDFIKRNARRSKWLQREWRVSYAGNSYLNVDGFNVVVYRRNDYWSACVKHRETGYKRFSQRRYATANQAKLASFDAMNGMKDSAELRRLREQIRRRELESYGLLD
jgi:hypothetical protein